MSKILIIVPAYNESANIEQVIMKLRNDFPSADILVVNDGSRDATGNIAKAAGVAVADLPFNVGIGAAMQTGYLYALSCGYDIAVQVDGDGQHPPDQISQIVNPIVDGKADIVVGSRFMGDGAYSPSVARNIGIKVFASVISMILGQRITDTTSGFRAVNRDVIRFFSGNYPDDYPEVEVLVLLHKAGFKLIEVPVKMENRKGGISSITPVRAIYYMIKVLLAVFIDLLKKVER